MVDDDVALLRVVREALAASLKCDVDTSPKPEYAFELALKKKYDLFIFDFQMPMIDGAMLFFLIGKVYQNIQPVREVPPLILVSGKAEEKRAQELLKEPGRSADTVKKECGKSMCAWSNKSRLKI